MLTINWTMEDDASCVVNNEQQLEYISPIILLDHEYATDVRHHVIQ